MLIGGHRIRTWMSAGAVAACITLIVFVVVRTTRVNYEGVGAVSASIAELAPMAVGWLALGVGWRMARRSVSRRMRLAFLSAGIASLPLQVIAISLAISLRPTALFLGAILGGVADVTPLTFAFGLLTIHWWTEDLRTS
jgi:hypothetical protein